MADLLIEPGLYHQMLGDVRRRKDEEACGLVAGKNGHAMHVYVITNELHSPTRYRLEPMEQIAAFFDMERRGIDLLAIYHSHLNGPGYPSETDRAEFAYPGVITLIWYPGSADWECRAYWIEQGRFSGADWKLELESN